MNIQALIDSQYSFLTNEFATMEDSLLSEFEKCSTDTTFHSESSSSSSSFGNQDRPRSSILTKQTDRSRPRNSINNPILNSPTTGPVSSSPTSGLQFPWKLHSMLDNASLDGYDSIVSWDGGNGFKVHNKEAFEREIAPRYFNHSKYRSFQRMLNMWGFERIRSGPRQGVYTHVHFRRGEPSLCHEMRCEKIKRRHTSPAKINADNSNSSLENSNGSLNNSESESALVSYLRRDGRTSVDSFEGKQFHLVDDSTASLRNEKVLLQEERIFQKPMNLVDHEVIDFKVLAMSSLSLLDVFQHGGDDDDGDEEEDFSNSTF